MGAQELGTKTFSLRPFPTRPAFSVEMAPKAMKSMKAGAKALTKGALCDAIAAQTELKKSECSKVLDGLAAIVTKEVKKAGKREMFGKVVVVKAKPAKTIVKAFPVAALKKS